MKTIPLSRGLVAHVDDEDYEWLAAHRWHASGPTASPIYAVRKGHALSKNRQSRVAMHRVILDAPDDLQVDHIDGNGLNNQRFNLRLATQSENARNRGFNKNNTSGFKGVSWNKREEKFTAQLRFQKKRIHLGYFATAEEAARVRDAAVIRLHGRFAWTNFAHQRSAA